jgi:hypothetical protein
MIKRAQAPKSASVRPSQRRRRRPIMPMLRRALRWSALVALAGLEFLSGIPGTIGGGFRTNAGAYEREF